MSYCVNCGVQLDRTAKRCPLCNTPIINPKELIDDHSPTPFPQKKGQVETVKHTDVAILLSSIFGSTAAACGLINLLVFRGVWWSLYIIGACIMLWVFFTPAFIYTRIPSYVSVFLDGIVVGIYCFFISINHPGNDWFLYLAVPIIATLTLLVVLYLYLRRTFKSSLLSAAILIFIELPIFCVGLEIYIRGFLDRPFRLTWSAIVLACCLSIVVVLVTIITRSRLRETVRRRMHL